ncbi:MAG: ferredoxin [Candidatus Pacebacteria bacterium]|nr:ferredoxin [Candidatus Paceibacterota bacterium]
MKIIQDKSKCINCGSCVAVCPEYFEMENGDVKLKNSKKEGELLKVEIEKEIGSVKEAIEICPVQALKLKK